MIFKLVCFFSIRSVFGFDQGSFFSLFGFTSPSFPPSSHSLDSNPCVTPTFPQPPPSFPPYSICVHMFSRRNILLLHGFNPSFDIPISPIIIITDTQYSVLIHIHIYIYPSISRSRYVYSSVQPPCMFLDPQLFDFFYQPQCSVPRAYNYV